MVKYSGSADLGQRSWSRDEEEQAMKDTGKLNEQVTQEISRRSFLLRARNVGAAAAVLGLGASLTLGAAGCYHDYADYFNGYSDAYANGYSDYGNGYADAYTDGYGDYANGYADAYSNYSNYSNYADYSNYSNYSNYADYSNYSNYSDYFNG
jgi:hypothetical protein